MSNPMTAEQVLDRYFLEMRCKVLDVAAALDRLERVSAAAREDARIGNLKKAIGVLLDSHPDRAERVQMIFSDPYDASWERPARKQ